MSQNRTARAARRPMSDSISAAPIGGAFPCCFRVSCSICAALRHAQIRAFLAISLGKDNYPVGRMILQAFLRYLYYLTTNEC